MKRLLIILIIISSLFISSCTKKQQPKVKPKENNTQIEETIDLDLTKLSSTLIYSHVSNMMTDPTKYVGKTIKVSGFFNRFYSKVTELYYPAVIIPDATNCCSQGIEFNLIGCVYPDGYPELNDQITVIGRFETYYENGSRYCHLVDARID